MHGRAGILTFDYPTIAEVTGYILDQLETSQLSTGVGNACSASAVQVRDIQALSPLPEPSRSQIYSQADKWARGIAILGVSQQRAVMGLEDPSGMPDFLGYEDAITAIPLSRWDLDVQIGADPQARFGGTVKGVDLFDLTAFQISSSEGLLVDPQQRLLLEVDYDSSLKFSRALDAQF